MLSYINSLVKLILLKYKGDDKKMLINKNIHFEDVIPSLDTKVLVLLAKKLLPDVVFNMASLEGNPFTFVDIQTLLDGITVGGHKLSDEQQILHIKDAWNYVFSTVVHDSVDIDINIFNSIHKIIAIDEALLAGAFRYGMVRIAGTEHIPPKADDLEEIFNTELEIIKTRCTSKIDLALELFLWGALNQFYFDGNKRTSRLVANFVLLSSGQGILNVKQTDQREFNALMIDFYNTKNADDILSFLYNKCLVTY